MKTKYKKLLIIIAVLIILLGITGVVYKINENKAEENVKILDVIEDSDYKLKENDSNLKKDLFYELKNILKEETINYEDYAKILSKLFVVDVFSLENKINKYDIGGLDYILEGEKNKFKLLMGDTIYDIIENNYDGKRTQELPVVKKVTILDVTESQYLFDKEEVLSYDINLEWEYEKDLDYDMSAALKLIKYNDKMHVISYSPNN